ncbi:MAG: DUF4249 family protein [Saprospiraceae bacterium]
MKRIFILSVLACGLLFSACSNEFELVDDWKSIPVVYGFLSLQDSAHYIRVEKAFLDPETSALEIARNPDSLYYQDITVQLIKGGTTYTMTRVDGNLEGYPRKDGIFATMPNYLYKLDSASINLKGRDIVKLVITDANDNTLTEASTEIVSDYFMSQSSPSEQINWDPDKTVRVRWRSTTDESGQFYDVKATIFYDESTVDNPTDFVRKEFNWNMGDKIDRNNEDGADIRVEGTSFFNVMVENIDESENRLRYFREMTIEVDAGGKELFDFVKVGQANTGITSAQVVPSFTNLSNGLGLFSSRYRLTVEGYTITGKANDFLKDLDLTENLNFQ